MPKDTVLAAAIHLLPSAEEAAEFQIPEKFVIQSTPAFVEVNKPAEPPPTNVSPSEDDAMKDI